MVVEFRDSASSNDYLTWTAAHWADGYVINIQRSFNPGDARLHRACCQWINGAPPRGTGFVGAYVKICAGSLTELTQWMTTHIGAEVRSCGSCRPVLNGQELPAGAASRVEVKLGLARSAVPGRPVGMILVTGAELDRLADACRPLEVSEYRYEQHDYLTNVLLTVLDLQMHTRTVDQSIRHYSDRRREQVRTLDDLEDLLSRFPDDRDGNTAVARYLWGNNHWVRVSWLRGLARFLAEEDLRSQEALTSWARRSDYARDFEGRVKFLGPAAYHWLLMRLGVDTVKPDVHLRRFVERVAGHRVSDTELIRAVTETARRLGHSARALDAAIWEQERAG